MGLLSVLQVLKYIAWITHNLRLVFMINFRHLKFSTENYENVLERIRFFDNLIVPVATDQSEMI